MVVNGALRDYIEGGLGEDIRHVFMDTYKFTQTIEHANKNTHIKVGKKSWFRLHFQSSEYTRRGSRGYYLQPPAILVNSLL